MTAETIRRPIPTPGDFAARQQARRTAEMLAPGTLVRGERFRPYFEQAIRASQMTPHSRLVAFALLSHANASTGEIPRERQPYLEGLIAATGLNSGQVVVQLNVLQQRGWVRREPTSPKAYERAVLHLAIPRYVLAQLRAS